jgi:hypothetical protein
MVKRQYLTAPLGKRTSYEVVWKKIGHTALIITPLKKKPRNSFRDSITSKMLLNRDLETPKHIFKII